MTDEKMAEEYTNKNVPVDTFGYRSLDDVHYDVKQAYLAGLEAGRPKWHKVADGDLPKVSGRYWVYTGGEPFTLDFDTEFNSFGYWVVSLGDDWGVRDEDFETVEDRGEDKVIAWCEVPKYTEE